MSNYILKLDESTANKIAAGEVVDRPASVVKELVENSIDAGAENIIIEIKDGGKKYIRITDDGIGIASEDVEIAFERHATSKIKEINDLDVITSLGFRGEALASIAAVSKIEIITKYKSSTVGTQTKILGGKFLYKKEVGTPTGTTIIVEDLFYNTPARLEFMKSNSSESAAITDMVSKLALSNPNISFQYINNGTIVFTTLGGKKLINNIVSIYGKELAKNLIEINSGDKDFYLEGYVSKPSYTRGNRQLQIFYINGRYVKSKLINDALSEVYKTLIPSNRYPVAFLYLTIRPNYLDINIHPTKLEIRMKDEELVKNTIIDVVKTKVFQSNIIPDLYKKSYTPKEFPLPKKSFKEEFTKANIINEDKNKIQKEEQLIFEDNFQYPAAEDIENTPKESLHSDNKGNVEKGEAPLNSQDKEIDFLKINLIGQAFQTYILGEFKENLYIIDQHAAHERVVFEELLYSYKNSTIASQRLISPIVIEVSHTQFENSKKLINHFNSIGFEVEEFGSNSFLLRSVPVIWGQPRAKELFIDILDNLYLDIAKNELVIEKIITQSCRSAIKAMDNISKIEMKELLRRLSALDNPYTCPHGRPTIVKLTKKEIEKRFMRT